MGRSASKTGLFLIELVIVILFFSISATVVMRIFAFSYTAARHSRDLSDAAASASNAAECFKASGGDLEDTIEILGGGILNGDNITIDIGDGLIMTLTKSREGNIIRGKIEVVREEASVFNIDALVIADAEGAK